MPQEVSDYFRASKPPRPVKDWLDSVIVQQCLIDEAFYSNPCPLAEKKTGGEAGQ